MMRGLEANGYSLAGHDCPYNSTDVSAILSSFRPHTVVIQDRREWDRSYNNLLALPEERFTNLDALANQEDVFRVTVCKDSHQKPEWHARACEEMGIHAWVVYYHPEIVCRLAPYVRRRHLIRTHHSIDPNRVPIDKGEERRPAILSGVMFSRYYPMRQAIQNTLRNLDGMDFLPHPGYHNRGTSSNSYLQVLSKYKVAICTTSIYGYALRKIIEATACGCRVITDLPEDEHLPMIGANLHRMPFDHHEVRRTNGGVLKEMIEHLSSTYLPGEQQRHASLAKSWYDYRIVGRRLTDDIEHLRLHYNDDD